MKKALASQKDEKCEVFSLVLVRACGSEPVSMVVTTSYGDFVEVARDSGGEVLPIPKSMARIADSDLALRLRRAYDDGDSAKLSDLWSQTGSFHD